MAPVSAMDRPHDQSVWEEDFSRLSRAGILVVVDHARAGNVFFVRVFDQHSQILTVPFNAYFYSSVMDVLGTRRTFTGAEAYRFLTQRSNFSLVAQDMTQEIAQEFVRMGDDPEGTIDRRKVRAVLSALVEQKPTVTRKDILVAMHVAYAHGIGRDVSPVRYLLINDSVVSRKRRVLEAVQADYAEYKFIHLVRDPRANFASLRHEYVNRWDSMYSLRRFLAGKEWSAWLEILREVTEGARELHSWRQDLDPARFRIVRNEDVNLRFESTLRKLMDWLGTDFHPPWASSDFVPTSNGRPWRSISAYSSTYQQNTRGPLRNDPAGQDRIPGPNREVTERWKRKLSAREIAVLEAVHLEELQDLDYERFFVNVTRSRRRAALSVLGPLRGEIPGPEWLRPRRGEGRALLGRLSYVLFFPFAYVLSRVRFLRLFRRGLLRTRPHDA